MDFIIGILLVMIAIGLLFNFTSISISDKKFGSGTCLNNYLISTMQDNEQNLLPIPSNANLGKHNSSMAINNMYQQYYFVN